MTIALPRNRPGGTVRVVMALGLGLTLCLTSCTATPAVTPDTSGTPSSRAAEAVPVPVPIPTSSQAGNTTPATASPGAGSTSPEKDASDIAPSVDAALATLAGSGDAVTSDRVRAAVEQGFADAGTAPEAVEVSIDSTPTGLDVDAIQGAGLIDGTCVVGEVREGAVTVVVLPALASGLCFVGDQR
ncbi:hypothetical protein IWX63_002240 [Arthrobacter sp. CAN_A2]|uniref:DUF6993 domain-containing protein n=1 Tax=Arthrobacter sp. CAN_A2 TaxID=2787718 RepID=UPI0018EF9EF3